MYTPTVRHPVSLMLWPIARRKLIKWRVPCRYSLYKCCRCRSKSFTDFRTRRESSLPLLWHTSSGLCCNGKQRWRDYLQKICCIIFSRHRDARLIILVNDRYDLPLTIKDDERQRRAAKHHLIPNVFPKPDDFFPATAEFNKVMVNLSSKVVYRSSCLNT